MCRNCNLTCPSHTAVWGTRYHKRAASRVQEPLTTKEATHSTHGRSQLAQPGEHTRMHLSLTTTPTSIQLHKHIIHHTSTWTDERINHLVARALHARDTVNQLLTSSEMRIMMILRGGGGRHAGAQRSSLTGMLAVHERGSN